MENSLKIVCPFCNAPYDAKMEGEAYDASGCDTCGPMIEGSIEITCTNCQKVVYKKEY